MYLISRNSDDYEKQIKSFQGAKRKWHRRTVVETITALRELLNVDRDEKNFSVRFSQSVLDKVSIPVTEEEMKVAFTTSTHIVFDLNNFRFTNEFISIQHIRKDGVLELCEITYELSGVNIKFLVYFTTVFSRFSDNLDIFIDCLFSLVLIQEIFRKTVNDSDKIMVISSMYREDDVISYHYKGSAFDINGYVETIKNKKVFQVFNENNSLHQKYSNTMASMVKSLMSKPNHKPTERQIGDFVDLGHDIKHKTHVHLSLTRSSNYECLWDSSVARTLFELKQTDFRP